MNKNKSFLCIMFIVSVMCLCALFEVYANSSIKVVVNDSAIAFTDAEPFIDDNGRTQVPVRALAESLGCDVQWNQEAQEVILVKNYTENDGIKAMSNDSYVCEKELHIFIGSSEYDGTFNTATKGTVTLSGTEWQGIKEMDTVPVVVNDRTYLPARYIAEFFDYSVSWDEAIYAVIIK